MKEIRLAEIKAELRAENLTADKQDAFKIYGMPIVFDTPTTIHDPAGEYIEIIRSGALDEADLTDSRLLYNHDVNKIPLARTPKTMTFNLTTAGLEMRADLPNTASGKEIYEAVKRGDLSGMSFAFKVPAGGDSYDPNTNTRTIRKISKVYEVSIVPYPAYPTTSVEARALMEPKEIKKQQALIKCNEIIARF